MLRAGRAPPACREAGRSRRPARGRRQRARRRSRGTPAAKAKRKPPPTVLKASIRPVAPSTTPSVRVIMTRLPATPRSAGGRLALATFEIGDLEDAEPRAVEQQRGGGEGHAGLRAPEADAHKPARNRQRAGSRNRPAVPALRPAPGEGRSQRHAERREREQRAGGQHVQPGDAVEPRREPTASPQSRQG